MNGDLLNLRPPPPHFPLIQSNELVPIILEQKGLRQAFLVDFKFPEFTHDEATTH